MTRSSRQGRPCLGSEETNLSNALLSEGMADGLSFDLNPFGSISIALP